MGIEERIFFLKIRRIATLPLSPLPASSSHNPFVVPSHRTVELTLLPEGHLPFLSRSLPLPSPARFSYALLRSRPTQPLLRFGNRVRLHVWTVEMWDIERPTTLSNQGHISSPSFQPDRTPSPRRPDALPSPRHALPTLRYATKYQTAFLLHLLQPLPFLYFLNA